MSELTDAEIKAIRERCDAATPGPWTADDRRKAPLKNIRVKTHSTSICEMFHVHQRDELWGKVDHSAADSLDAVGLANADFIAHAREDVPALLDALEAANKRIAELSGALRRATETIANDLQDSRASRIAGIAVTQKWPPIHDDERRELLALAESLLESEVSGE